MNLWPHLKTLPAEQLQKWEDTLCYLLCWVLLPFTTIKWQTRVWFAFWGGRFGGLFVGFLVGWFCCFFSEGEMSLTHLAVIKQSLVTGIYSLISAIWHVHLYSPF